MLLPIHRSVFDQKLHDAAEKSEQKRAFLHEQAAKPYNTDAKPLPSLSKPRHQEIVHNRYIVDRGRSKDYLIRTPDGKFCETTTDFCDLSHSIYQQAPQLKALQNAFVLLIMCIKNPLSFATAEKAMFSFQLVFSISEI